MDYLIGYGSLLNKFSREHYSNICQPAVHVQVQGWYRSWCAAYPDEGATYAGAQRRKHASLEAVLIATEMDSELQDRERNYEFLELTLSDLIFSDNACCSLNHDDRILICASTDPRAATADAPLPQTYVDTCMLGCLELGGNAALQRFVEQTEGWDGVWIDDRRGINPVYPRLARPNPQQIEIIDQVLADNGVLKHRSTAI